MLRLLYFLFRIKAESILRHFQTRLTKLGPGFLKFVPEVATVLPGPDRVLLNYDLQNNYCTACTVRRYTSKFSVLLCIDFSGPDSEQQQRAVGGLPPGRPGLPHPRGGRPRALVQPHHHQRRHRGQGCQMYHAAKTLMIWAVICTHW